MVLEAPPQPGGQPTLAERMGNSIVSTRNDLEVSRHVFRDEVAYVIRDPLTCQVQRLGAREYRLFNAVNDSRTLSEHCDFLIKSGILKEGQAETFFRFVMQLHKLGFLKLPIQEDDGLYERHLTRQAGKRKARLMWIYSAQIPIFNPERFLNATVRFARPFFTPFAFALWCIFVATAIYTGIQNAAEFAVPAMDIFSGPNLPLLWITLVGLKVVHEFGHAYACKIFGGRVPEMGIMLIAGAPLAYMDATSSWSFPSKLRRIIVCLGGMYVEVGLAAAAFMLWTVTPPGVLKSVLHNLVTLAGITTIVMNINPLMRYDGYYALTDALEMPNLRGRATAFTMALLKRILLGLPMPKTRESLALRSFYVIFGISSALYKITIVLSISAAIATKFFIAGTLLGGIYVANSLWTIIKKSVPFLWSSPDTQPMRPRAVTVLIIFFALLPIATFGIPVPATVAAPGLIAGTNDVVLRAESPGFLADLNIQTGDVIPPGTQIAKLANAELGDELASAEARRVSAAIRARVQIPLDPTLAKMESERESHAASEVAHWQAKQNRLTIAAPAALKAPALVIQSLAPTDVGRWVETGEAIATLSREHTNEHGRKALALFDATDLAGTSPKIGDQAWFQPISQPHRRLAATITAVTPTGSRQLSADFTEHLNLADLALNPATGEVGQTQFVIELQLAPMQAVPPFGLTGRIRLKAKSEPLGLLAIRKTLIFIAKL